MEQPPIDESLSDNSPEGVAERKLTLWAAAKERFNKLTKIMAFAALISGANPDTLARDVEAAKGYRQKDGLTRVQQGEATDKETAEYKKKERVEAICKKNGFDFVDANDMDVILPPEDVKNVIIYLGKIHRGISFEKVSEEAKKTVLASEQRIFDKLRDASTISGKKIPCIAEGIGTQERADFYMPDETTMKLYGSFSLEYARSSYPIEHIVNTEVKKASNFIKSRPQFNDSAFLDLTMINMSIATRTAMETAGLTEIEKARLNKLAWAYDAEVNHDRMTYFFGGEIVASQYGFVRIHPGDDRKINEVIPYQICKDLGVDPVGPDNFYEFMKGLRPDLKKKAHELLDMYATSVERESPALKSADEQLKDTDVVAMPYGGGHTFVKSMKYQYDQGLMRDTALIKVDVRYK